MIALDQNHVWSEKELCETVEALLGATYQTQGLESCRKVILSLKRDYGFFNPDLTTLLDKNSPFSDHNPKGRLLELFQKENLQLPEFQTKRVGGEDHNPLFQSSIETYFKNNNFKAISDVHPSKKSSEKDVSLKLLKQLNEKDVTES